MMVVATRLAAGHTRHISLKDGDIPIRLHWPVHAGPRTQLILRVVGP
jgi:hypothetical protein